MNPWILAHPFAAQFITLGVGMIIGFCLAMSIRSTENGRAKSDGC